MIDHIHVCVCVPNTGSWRNETAKSVALMFSYFAQNRVGKAKSQRLSLLTAEGSMLSQSRQNLAQKAMKAGCTHIMFIDSDMEFPMNTLNEKPRRTVLRLNADSRPIALELQAEGPVLCMGDAWCRQCGRPDARRTHGGRFQVAPAVNRLIRAGNIGPSFTVFLFRHVFPPHRCFFLN
jgi:hypothetical protein